MKTHALALLALCTSACLSAEPPQPVRSFAPPIAPAEAAAVEERLPLALAPLRSAGHLKHPIVWRRSEVEYGAYGLRQWAELPVAYLERALARRLFESGAFARSERSGDARLEVELLAFEERLEPRHAAAVGLRMRLRAPGGGTLVEESFEELEPLPDARAESLARALGVALARAVERVAERSRAALEAAGES